MNAKSLERRVLQSGAVVALSLLLLCISMGSIGVAFAQENDGVTPPADTTSIVVNSIAITDTGGNAGSLTVGATDQLTAVVSPDNATTPTVTWFSDNTAIATVDSNSGLVTAIGIGTANITAISTNGSQVTSNTIVVTVVAPPSGDGGEGSVDDGETQTIAVTGITLNESSHILYDGSVGNTDQLTATIVPANATNQTITYTSSNANAASVDSSGLVTAHAAGEGLNVTITATAAGGLTATDIITVSPTVAPHTSLCMVGSCNSNLPLFVNGPFSLQINFTNVPIVSFTNNSVHATNAVISNAATSTPDNDNFTFLVTPITDGTVSVSIEKDAVQGIDGINNFASNPVTTTYDATPPVITSMLSDMTLEAADSSGAVATFTDPEATDANGISSFGCAPASGSTFAIGTTNVVCTATDNAGNSAAQSFTVTVAKFGQTITFGSLADKAYGDADFSVSATASSGLSTGFTAQGGCTVSDGMVGTASVHITGAGSCTITAHQAGSDIYNAAPDVSQTFTVAPAPLTITANDQSKVYGASEPMFTASYNGFVNGDTASSLTTPVSFDSHRGRECRLV